MLNIEWPDEYYNSYEEPSQTMEVNFDRSVHLPTHDLHASWHTVRTSLSSSGSVRRLSHLPVHHNNPHPTLTHGSAGWRAVWPALR